LAVALPGHGALQPFVTADYARLRRVLMHSPTLDDQIVYLTTGEPLDPMWLAMPPDVVAQHEQLVQFVRASGAEVLQVQDLLASAIREAKRQGVWRTWLSGAFPQFGAAADRVTEATLLSRDPRYQFQKDTAGNYHHVQDGLIGMWYTRDFGVMTPSGLIVCNFFSQHRRREVVLFRFMTQFAPELRGYPVVFDAAQEGLYIEGGDVQVLDERTLLLGVGNRTDPRVAPVLAQRLDMDVIAVQMRKTDFLKYANDPNPLRVIFLHLDTCFTLLGPKHAVAFPWLFEARYAKENPLIGFMKGVAASEGVSEEDATKAVSYFQDMGQVRWYVAGSGVEDDSVKGLELVDYVRRRGFEVLNVGGPPPEEVDYRHLVDVVLCEHEREATNVLATAPNQVIGYEGAVLTQKAFAAAGVTVSVFNGRELWRGQGGPHCLTLPLERG
jgi:arginine deiminase